MFDLYYVPSCKSFKPLTSFLDRKNVPYILHDLTQDPISFEEFKYILSLIEDNPLDLIISKASAIYRSLNKEHALSEDLKLSELHAIMAHHPSMFKTPILVGHGRLFINPSVKSIHLLTREDKKQVFAATLAKVKEIEGSRSGYHAQV